MEFSVRVIPDSEKPAVWQSYLIDSSGWLRGFFRRAPVRHLRGFEPIAARYPVLELIRIRPEDSPESPESRE